MDACVASIAVAIVIFPVIAIPPPQCFANFRWDDCGRKPEPVMYYWKPGSRCEVGLWRGCLPNINMFKDEYECVSTCIFSVRARESDWHELNQLEEESTPMDYDSTTDITTTEGDDNSTNVDGSDEDNSETTPKPESEPDPEPEAEAEPEPEPADR